MLGSVLIAAVVVAVVASAAGIWWRSGVGRRRAIAYDEVEPGGRFELGAWQGARLAADVSFQLEVERAAGGWRVVAVGRDGDRWARTPLDALPMQLPRIEFDHADTRAARAGGDHHRRRHGFVARERGPEDEAFAAAYEAGETTALAPLVPSSRGWEGLRLRAPRQLHHAREVARHRAARVGPGVATARLIVAGVYLARPSVMRAAASDWAFSRRPSPMLVLKDAATGTEIVRATLDRIEGEYRARVDGLSITHAMPPPVDDGEDATVPDDDRREGGRFAVDVGFYLEPRSSPWRLAIHAELGPLRSAEVIVEVHP